METKPQYFKQFEESLDKRLSSFATKTELAVFATKDDLKTFATKKDLRVFATKDDLKGLARKEDLKVFATKDDLEILELNLTDKFEDLNQRTARGFEDVMKRLDVADRTTVLEKKMSKIEKALHIGLKDLD